MWSRISGKQCVWAQMLIVLGTLGATQLLPSQHGAMLLISTPGASQGAVVNYAIGAGARIMGAGPLPSSLLVFGDRDRLLAASFSAGIVPLRVPEMFCGSPGGGAI